MLRADRLSRAPPIQRRQRPSPTSPPTSPRPRRTMTSPPVRRRTTSSPTSPTTPPSSASPTRPAVGARTSVERRTRRGGSARSCGATSPPSSCSSTAGRRTPTPGTPWPWPSTARSSPSTFPATVTPTRRPPVRPASTPSRSPPTSAWRSPQLAPDAAAVVGMSLGGLTAIALAATRPELVRRLVLVDITPGVDREKAKAITDFVRGPATFASFDEILARTIEHNPTRTEASLRRGILHNAEQLDDGSWRWRYRRHDDDGLRLGRPTSTPRTGCGTPSARVTVPVMLVRGMRPQSVVDDADEAELRRRLPGRPRRALRRRRPQRAGRHAGRARRRHRRLRRWRRRPGVKHFDVAERRRRLLLRHHLAVAGGTQRRGRRRRPRRAARHRSGNGLPVVAATPRAASAIGDLDAALYERRSLARLLGMRRTMFVVPLDLAARDRRVVHADARRPGAPTHGAAARGGRASTVPRRSSATPARRRWRCCAGRAAAGPGDHPDRHPAPTAGAARRGQALRGAGLDHQPDPPAAVDRGPHRAHPPARLVAVEPVPLDDGRSGGSPIHWPPIRAAEARTELRPPVVAHVRAGDDQRHRLVGEVDEEAGRSTPSASSAPSRSPSSRRRALRPCRHGSCPTTSTT